MDSNIALWLPTRGAVIQYTYACRWGGVYTFNARNATAGISLEPAPRTILPSWAARSRPLDITYTGDDGRWFLSSISGSAQAVVIVEPMGAPRVPMVVAHGPINYFPPTVHHHLFPDLIWGGYALRGAQSDITVPMMFAQGVLTETCIPTRGARGYGAAKVTARLYLPYNTRITGGGIGGGGAQVNYQQDRTIDHGIIRITGYKEYGGGGGSRNDFNGGSFHISVDVTGQPPKEPNYDEENSGGCDEPEWLGDYVPENADMTGHSGSTVSSVITTKGSTIFILIDNGPPPEGGGGGGEPPRVSVTLTGNFGKSAGGGPGLMIDGDMPPLSGGSDMDMDALFLSIDGSGFGGGSAFNLADFLKINNQTTSTGSTQDGPNGGVGGGVPNPKGPRIVPVVPDGIFAKIPKLVSEIFIYYLKGNMPRIEAELVVIDIFTSLPLIDVEVVANHVIEAELPSIVPDLSTFDIFAELSVLGASLDVYDITTEMKRIEAALDVYYLITELPLIESAFVGNYDLAAELPSPIASELIGNYDIAAELRATIESELIGNYVITAALPSLESALSGNVGIAAELPSPIASELIGNYVITAELTLIGSELNVYDITAELTLIGSELNVYDITAELPVIGSELNVYDIAADLTVIESELNVYDITAELTAIEAELAAGYSISAELTLMDSELNVYDLVAELTLMEAGLDVYDITAELTKLESGLDVYDITAELSVIEASLGVNPAEMLVTSGMSIIFNLFADMPVLEAELA